MDKINNQFNKIPLRVVSTFSGVGMQERGIQNTGLYDMNVVATCELDTNAIIAYAAIHNGLTNEMIQNYNSYPSREDMANHLSELNIGYDFKKKKPYDWNKVAKSKDSKNLLKKTWLACTINKNHGDISTVHDFPECDLLTFSFPCTDISIQGKLEGIVQGETRSGLVYEVLRILNNMKDMNKLPTYLLMENVDALINKKNKPSFDKLNEEFSALGYQVKYDILNTKFCGIPQNRRRCFALYSLNDISEFTFPLPFDNGLRLKDILQKEVDDKYYINNETTKKFLDTLILNGELIWQKQ